MPTFNIPYEELDINEGRHQYEINCIGIRAINSAKSLEYSKGWLETLFWLVIRDKMLVNFIFPIEFKQIHVVGS